MKKFIAAVGVLLLCSFGICASQKEFKPLLAEGEEPETSEPVEVSEEPVVESSEPEAVVEQPVEEDKVTREEIEQKITAFKDTYLVPLLSGVSITTIISCGLTILFAFKNRKTNTLIAKVNAITQEQAKKAIDCVKEIEDQANLLLEQAQMYKDLAFEMKDRAIEQSKVMLNQVNELKGEVEKLFEMKACMIMLINTQVELAKINPQVVSSGVVKQLEALNEQAKKLL